MQFGKGYNSILFYKKLTKEITGVNKPEYGKRVVIEISKRLSVDYETGFDCGKRML